MSNHPEHRPDRYEQEQMAKDEALAAKLQEEENLSASSHHIGQGRQSGAQYRGSDQYQGYQGQPPQQYQGQPPQGYQGGPPSQYQSQPQQNYQGASPQGYQEDPQQHQQEAYQYQQGPQPEYQGASQYQGHTQYQGGPPPTAQHPYAKVPQPLRRKSLLIGINYVGSKNALRGCHQDVTNMSQFLSYKGYSTDQRSQVIMRDDPNTDPQGPFFPTGKNMLAAMHWLISEPNTCNFLHYSGHGSQVKDPDGDRESGFDDTIVPVDFDRLLNNQSISQNPCLILID
jgi:hypothetical protein